MANDQMRQNWATGAAGWVQNERLFDALYAPVTQAILRAAQIGAGQRVLDIGCGTGTLLEAVAEAGAQPIGADISPAMAEAARKRVPDAVVVVADAQTTTFPGAPVDRVVSRFGVMFFDDPVAAFANIRSATVQHARLAFVCWRALAENPVFDLGTDVLLDQLEDRPPPPAPGAPGPGAFADPGHVRSILTSSGWAEIDVQPLDFVCDYGFGGTDGVEERMAYLLGTSSGRMAQAELEPRLGPEGWAQVLTGVRAELRQHLTQGVLRIPGATWLVTAENW